MAYGGGPVLADITTEIGPGSVAVTGPSGSGKSTMLRLLGGAQAPDMGSVSLDGRLVQRGSWREAAEPRVATVFQDHRLIDFLSVLDNLIFAAEVRGQRGDEARAIEQLHRVGLGDIDPGRSPVTLSGGQQQRVAIARALMAQASVILADEPTGALDAATTDEVTDALLEAASSGDVLLVVATHDERVSTRMATRLELRDGALAEVGR